MCQVYQNEHEHECPSCRADFTVYTDEDATEEEAKADHPQECPECGIKLVWDHENHVAFPAEQMVNMKPVEEAIKKVESETTR